jgi:hypothetical protein
MPGKYEKLITDLSDLPINLCISCALPFTFPFDESLGILLCADLGSIEYSAVSHPSSLSFKNGGTL